MAPPEWRQFQQSIYDELKDMSKKMDQANEQITILRIEMAEHRVKINEGRKFYSSLWGVIGGAASAAIVALVDFVFKK